MNRILTVILALGLPGMLGAAAIEPRQDLLRFSNGDQLHGSYQGIKDGLLTVWQRDDLAAPSEFKAAQIHKIILRGARPAKSNESLSHVALVNGDRIPGTLTGLDDESVTVDSTCAGIIRIPRGIVGMVAPAPMGGRVTFHGPYTEDGWLMVNAAFPDGIPPLDPAAKKAAEETKKDTDEAAGDAEPVPAEEKSDEDADAAKKAADPARIPRWNFSGSAWYWSNKQGETGLVHKTGMGDRAVLRFNVAWRNRLMLCVAFHADFAKPAEPAKPAADGDADNKVDQVKRQMLARIGQGDSSFPRMFGNSYVLQINSGYAMLLRCGFDDKGNPLSERLQMNNPSIRLSETGTAAFELRCDRAKGVISLHVDGAPAMEWTEPAAAEDGGYAGKGGGFGFVTKMENSMVRIADIVAADWNGMPDAARSMQSDDQDIVLLANGTDRFSGKITGLLDGKLRLHGKFGDFALPLADVAELRFATNGLTKPGDPAAGAVTVRIDPIGNLTGKPLSGDARRLKLATQYAGEIDINLDAAVMLDFQPSTNYLDDWDQAF